MKAAYLLNKAIHVGDFPDPKPGKGEVLVRTHSCGLCASDLHLMLHGDALSDWSRRYNGPFEMDLSRPMVLGHEYVAEIVDYGLGTERRLKLGTRVTSQPRIPRDDNGFAIVGISNDYPGGFGEYMLLSEEALRPLPDGLDTDRAAMAEPISVGLSYVLQARLSKDDVPLVVGCGAIGLAMIMALKLEGRRPIVASDLSPHRRELARHMGADYVVDPREASPYEAPAGGEKAPNVIFECVGVPGVVDQIIRQCAYGARLIIPGWCLEPDHMLTVCAHTKALNLQFGCPSMDEGFERAVRALGEGEIDPTPWLGGRIRMDQVDEGLRGIADPLNPIRLVVDPRLGML